MHDVQAIEILGIDVSTILDQNRTYLYIASERGIVKSSELILRSLLVNPHGDLMLINTVLGLLDNGLEHPKLILKNSHVQESVSIIIYELVEFDLRRQLVQKYCQVRYISFVDQLHALFANLLNLLLESFADLPTLHGLLRDGALSHVVTRLLVT